MSTTTTRIGLTKPDPSDPMSIGDLVLANNYRELDEAVGATRAYTSGTRPTGSDRWVGRVIWESDTNNFLWWDGANWLYWGNNLSGRDVYAASSGLSTTTIAAGTEALHQSVTFDAVNSRRYQFLMSDYYEYGNVDANFLIRVRWAAGSSVTTAGTLLYTSTGRNNSSGLVTGKNFYDAIEFQFSGSTGQITVGWFVVNQGAADLFVGHTQTGSEEVAGTMVLRDYG